MEACCAGRIMLTIGKVWVELKDNEKRIDGAEIDRCLWFCL